MGGDSSGLTGGFWLHGVEQGWMLERNGMVGWWGLGLLLDVESQMCRVDRSGGVFILVR
jgi:hypothetical protein